MSWSAKRRNENTPEVQRLKRAALKRCHYQCEMHGRHCTLKATEVDHIIPLFEGGQDVMSNVRGVCHECHDAKSRAERTRALKATYKKLYRPHPVHPGLA